MVLPPRNRATMGFVKVPEPSVSNEAQLAGALHEVSNALTVVLGWIAEAQSQTHAGPVQEALEVAQKYARRGHRVARAAIGAEVPEDVSTQLFDGPHAWGEPECSLSDR